MRSYFIEGLSSHEIATEGLTEAFPEQSDHLTKVLTGPGGSNVCYLYVGEQDDSIEQDGRFLIQADVSGRFFDFDVDEYVVSALRRIQERVGGVVRDDDGNTV
jgi:hypothetical protein